jgi:hypothetical protein
MRRKFDGLLLALLASVVAAAQMPIQWEQGVNSLNGGWRTHSGDDKAWAAPGFDDSSWQLTTLLSTGEQDSTRKWGNVRFADQSRGTREDTTIGSFNEYRGRFAFSRIPTPR